MSVISDNFKHGKNVDIGNYVIIEDNVVVGDNVKIGHRVTLKEGTIVLNNAIIDDHCITTGICYIGNDTNVRTGAIISRGTIIEDKSFIGPGVITNHTKNVTHCRENQVKKETLLTYICFGSIIGSQASLLAGLYLGSHTIIGGGSVVVQNLDGYGIYVGAPCKKISNLPEEYYIKEPDNTGYMYLNNEVINYFKKYMPNLNLNQYKDYINRYK